jgi:hypothetical protein
MYVVTITNLVYNIDFKIHMYLQFDTDKPMEIPYGMYNYEYMYITSIGDNTYNIMNYLVDGNCVSDPVFTDKLFENMKKHIYNLVTVIMPFYNYSQLKNLLSEPYSLDFRISSNKRSDFWITNKQLQEVNPIKQCYKCLIAIDTYCGIVKCCSLFCHISCLLEMYVQPNISNKCNTYFNCHKCKMTSYDEMGKNSEILMELINNN